MKSDWTLRWWDLIALFLALGVAALIVQYAVSRGTIDTAQYSGPAMVVVCVPRPMPELAAVVIPGDKVINSRGEKVAEVLSVQSVLSAGENKSVIFPGKEDLLITLRVEGALRLVRDLPGFPREPCGLKAGAWCLVSTPKVELSGIVVKVERE
ncbi:hypothetical protein KAR10_05925 [bacterium]|nr:hypothetical protein [bacterium]